MEGFEFGNARVRAMRSRLLDGESLSLLAASGDIDALILNLAETPYRESVEAALVRQRGLESINSALNHDLNATFGRLPDFYSGDPQRMIELALTKYEIHNVTTVLRGIVQEAPVSETTALLMPVGTLSIADLTALAKSADLRQAIDLLATWRSPLSLPLLESAAARPRAGLPFLELALTCWYHRALAEYPSKSRSWRSAMDLETDIANLLIALRLVGRPEALESLQEEPDPDGPAAPSAVELLFCGSGGLSSELLLAIARQPTLSAALLLLEGTELSPLLRPALGDNGGTPSLAGIEHALLRYQLQSAARLYVADALGMGVPLGYIRMKTAELINLRLIAYAIALELNEAWLARQLLLLPTQSVELRLAHAKTAKRDEE